MAPTTYRKLEDKHVLIIGGSAGIGYAVAEASLSDGAHVTIASSTKARVDAAVSTLQSQYGATAVVHGFVCDVSSSDPEASLEELFSAASAAPGAGPVNHVVFTASNGLSVLPVHSVTAEQIVKATHMRMVVPILLAKVASRYLPKSSSSSLTLTSGLAADRPFPGWSVLCFLAGGMQSLVRGLALDLKPVRVNLVKPGLVRTDLWKSLPVEQLEGLLAQATATLPVGAIGLPEDVAEAYLWLMKDRFATGTEAASNGGGQLV